MEGRIVPSKIGRAVATLILDRDKRRHLAA